MPIRSCQSVLYVDDDPDICAVVQATLCLIDGLDVYTAESGERGIDLAYEMRPDVVLMDVMMPGLDGPATLKRMREHPLIGHIPVIFITAKVLPEEVAEFLKLGAIGVIRKPFDPRTLGQELFALWEKSASAHEIGPQVGAQRLADGQLDALSRGYLERLVGDVATMREMIGNAGRGGRDLLKDVERVAHSIHGGGAMFGFPKISLSAGVIERYVRHMLARQDPGRRSGEAAELQQLAALAEQLDGEVDAAVHGRSPEHQRPNSICGPADATSRVPVSASVTRNSSRTIPSA